LSHLQQETGGARPASNDAELERLARVLIERTIVKDRDHVEVAVDDGWATLSGEVSSARCKCDVERHVRSLAGVKGLTSHIEITATGPITGAGSVAGFGWPLSGE
jgi:osmotically-inducible protein OsmY